MSYGRETRRCEGKDVTFEDGEEDFSDGARSLVPQLEHQLWTILLPLLQGAATS